MPTPNEYPATVECPQCEHEVETTLYVYLDGSGAYVYGKHCPECDEAVAMDMSFVLPGAARWSGLCAWLTGERIALEGQLKRMPPDPAEVHAPARQAGRGRDGPAADGRPGEGSPPEPETP